MTNRHAVPPIGEALLNYLDTVYPEQCADPRDSDREIWMKAGERRLVQRLRNLCTRQDASGSVGIAV